MRHVFPLETCILFALTSVVLVMLVLFSAGPAVSAERSADAPGCSCPDAQRKSARPKFADLNATRLDVSDEIAALESIQLGLSRMDDGAPFVWRHANGRLSGIVRPTVSFRNAKGYVCRHVMVLLTTGYKTSTAEGIACRMDDRRWVLEG